jgi:hypothetical protein
MTKPFKTRFSDTGRVDKTFARLQDSLEWGAKRGNTAVFTTLTTDPKKHDSLLDAILNINRNFHALNQWMKRDPKTKADTRENGVPAWRAPGGTVSGRPREKLEYVKVLEFTDAGYPHLHVLYFNPPCRESDGMPWLCDKAELSHYWNKDTHSRPGQGRIVDTWPLVYRDDLDDVEGAKFNADEGFVSWYRYGDHDHGDEWVEEHSDQHDQIDFDGDECDPYEKTAGAYIGKYLAETYALLQNQEALDDPDWSDSSEGKSAWWKLALYWTTNRRFWSPSRQIERDIALDGDRADIRRGVKDATRTALEHYTDRFHQSHALYDQPNADERSSFLHFLTDDLVTEMELSEVDDDTGTTFARVEHVGTYHVDDLPPSPKPRADVGPFEDAAHDDSEPLVLSTAGDRPPPALDAWTE